MNQIPSNLGMASLSVRTRETTLKRRTMLSSVLQPSAALVRAYCVVREVDLVQWRRLDVVVIRGSILQIPVEG